MRIFRGAALTLQGNRSTLAVMLQEIEQLLVIQDRDKRIRTLRLELKNAPVERKALEARLAAANQGAEAAKAKLKELEVQRKKLQVDAQSKRDQIARFKAQQSATRKNDEYQALANEIAHFGTEVERIEDQELELMEAIEKQEGVVKEAEAAAAVAREKVAAQIADLDAKVKTLQQNLASVETDRAGLAKGVNEDLLKIYERLFANKGEAVVPLDHDVCMGCHMKLTTQTALRVRGEQTVTHCEQCGRILYLPQ